MDSSQLLNRLLANRLVCQTQQIAKGPTGPTGPTAIITTIPGLPKAFTIFIDYDSNTSGNPITSVYIPPGLFTTNTTLAPGGTFTADVGTDLMFIGQPNPGQIVINNTTYAFVSGISANGYVNPGSPSLPRWQVVAQRNIQPGPNNIGYIIPNDNSLTLYASVAAINGGQVNTRPVSGTATGFLATVTLFYI